MPFSQFGNKKTKIVATLGPSSWDEHHIRRMIQKGLNVVRINFSHGEHETHARTIEMYGVLLKKNTPLSRFLLTFKAPRFALVKLMSLA